MKTRPTFRFALVALSLLVGVTGCGTISEYVSGTDNVEPPAELVRFDETVAVKTLWRRNVGAADSKRRVRLVPAAQDTKIFAADRKGRVRAFDASTGDSIWDTDTDQPISGGPGTGEGLVLVGTKEGEVLALEASDGKIRWRARVSSEVLAAPQAAQGVAVVRTGDGKLFGLNVADGARLWVYDRTVPVLTLRGTSAPIIHAGLAICGFDNGRLVGVALEDGQPAWDTRVALPRGRTDLERLVDIDSQPTVEGDAVYVATFQGRVAAVDLRSGQVLWRRDMSSHAGIGVDAGALYVTDEQNYVWALDRSNSASLWRQTKLRGRGLTAPVSYGDYVVVGDQEGYLHWMRREDGQFVARQNIDGNGIAAAPLVVGDTLFVYGRGGTLAALKAP